MPGKIGEKPRFPSTYVDNNLLKFKIKQLFLKKSSKIVGIPIAVSAS
jgi:hypothetical protein